MSAHSGSPGSDNGNRHEFADLSLMIVKRDAAGAVS
jgi:hypothetical protein